MRKRFYAFVQINEIASTLTLWQAMLFSVLVLLIYGVWNTFDEVIHYYFRRFLFFRVKNYGGFRYKIPIIKCQFLGQIFRTYKRYVN